MSESGYQPVLEVSKEIEEFIRANAPKSGTLAGLWSFYQRKGGLTQKQLDHIALLRSTK